jgi:hypothetical protein
MLFKAVWDPTAPRKSGMVVAERMRSKGPSIVVALYGEDAPRKLQEPLVEIVIGAYKTTGPLKLAVLAEEVILLYSRMAPI